MINIFSKDKLNDAKQTVCAGVLPLLLVFFSFIFLFSPNTRTQATGSDFNLSVSAVISLSLSSCDSLSSSIVSIEITPNSSGVFKSNCQTAEIDTNAPGYTFAAKVDTSTLNYQNPTMVSPPPTIPSTLNTIGGSPEPSTLANDTWGFAVEGSSGLGFDTIYIKDNANNKFASLSTSGTTIYSTANWPLQQTVHKFYYAAKLTTATMAGTYSATITYTVIGTEPPEVPSLTDYLKDVTSNYGISTMQTLTSNICELVTYDETNFGNNANNIIVLNDTRNNQSYRVRKTADNNCWMMDNLKLATPGSELMLTSDDTNIPNNTTFTIPPDAITNASNVASNGICANGATPSGTRGYLTCLGTDYDVSDSNFGFIAYVDPSGTENCSNNTTINDDTNTYSLESLSGCGYLYNWYTATAGSGNYSSISDVDSSICPINWRLPSAGDGTNVSSNDFAILNGAMVGEGPSILSDATTYLNWRPTGAFSGVYAGRWATTFSDQGLYGYYWSSSIHSGANARALFSAYDFVTPGNSNYDIFYGNSIRCVL